MREEGGSMGRLFRVRVDLELLRCHLLREDQRDVSIDEVRKFLRDSAFSEKGEWWTIREEDLGAVERSEVLQAVVLDDLASE
jgi:hypothetical protein